MEKSIIAEGKTTNEAIENGLKQLNVSKNMVDIKVLENEEKRSFFSILAPRIVKVQITLKEKEGFSEKKVRKEIELAEEELKKAEQNLTKFLDDFIEKIDSNIQYTIEKSNFGLNVNIKNGESGFLIGYRGETLYAFQNILSSVAGKGIENRVRIILDVEGYKEKREKTLEELAEKIAKKRGIKKMSAQAVGGAVGSNPICIIIPCHRVVGKNGKLTGYGGGIKNKEILLEHEQNNKM